MAAQKTIDYILRVLKQGRGAADASDDLKKTGQAAEEAEKKTSSLGKVAKVAEGAVIAMGLAALKSVPQLIDQGIAIDRARTALEAYAGSSQEADRFVREMGRAVDGSISNMGLMQNATRLLSMDLAGTASEAAELTDIAVTLGATMGKGPQEAFEEFTLLLANQSILRLDTFGISGAQVRERMEELAEQGIAPADRQLRFMTATMEVANEKMGQLDAAGFQATSSVDKLKAQIDNAKDGLASWLADGIVPAIDGVMQFKERIDAKQESVVATTDSYEEYKEKLRETTNLIPPMSEATYDATKAQLDLDEQLEISAQNSDLYAGWVRGATTATDDFAAAADNAVLSIVGFSEAAVAQTAIQNLSKALDEGWISVDEYNTALIDIHTNLLDTPNVQIVASQTLADLSQDFQDGKIDIDDYVTAVLGLGSAIRNIPEYKRVDVEVVTSYREGGPGHDFGTLSGGYQHGGQFTVGGPAGVDRTPVFFWATRGETVTVTPAGQPAPQQNNYSMPIYGGLTLQNISNVESLLDELSGMMV